MSYTIRPFRRTGGWEVDIVITYPSGEKYRERRKAPVDSKSAAKRWARERELHLLQHGRPPRRGEKNTTPTKEAPTVPTLAEFVPRYLEYVKANRQKPSTRKAKQTICRCHLIPALGHLRLNEIGPADVERLKARHANHSAKTLNNDEIGPDLLECVRVVDLWEAETTLRAMAQRLSGPRFHACVLRVLREAGPRSAPGSYMSTLEAHGGTGATEHQHLHERLRGRNGERHEQCTSDVCKGVCFEPESPQCGRWAW